MLGRMVGDRVCTVYGNDVYRLDVYSYMCAILQIRALLPWYKRVLSLDISVIEDMAYA